MALNRLRTGREGWRLSAVALTRMLERPDHALWMLFQQVFVRGLLALKFLLAARYLGPEQMGLVGIAMLSLAIVESLSDTGMVQAVIQRQGRVNPQQAGAVWTLQIVRGAALAVALLVLAVPISLLLKVPASGGLIIIAAILPPIRNAINPGMYLVQRDRNFRRLAFYEGAGAATDFIVSILLINIGFGAASILLGTIASDSLKLLISWTWLRAPLLPSFRWKEIKELTAFGKWIWGASIATLALNQLDKILVARFLGATEFGFYQVAARIAQLIVADAAVALGQYLFPTFSQKNRISRQAIDDYFGWVMKRLIPIEGGIALLLVISAALLVEIMLGPKWEAAVPVLRVMTLAMVLGGVIAIMVAYCRAVGRPKMVTQAVFVQLIVLILAAPILIIQFGSIGMASASTLALGASTIYLAKKIKRGFV